MTLHEKLATHILCLLKYNKSKTKKKLSLLLLHSEETRIGKKEFSGYKFLLKREVNQSWRLWRLHPCEGICAGIKE
jgi:hypothetical protein